MYNDQDSSSSASIILTVNYSHLPQFFQIILWKYNCGERLKFDSWEMLVLIPGLYESMCIIIIILSVIWHKNVLYGYAHVKFTCLSREFDRFLSHQPII
jgi:hypothetical protein